MKFYSFNDNPTVVDRIICLLSYLTMGLVGFIWLIIISVQKAYFKPFLKYHILQSIFISVLIYIFGIVAQILLGMITLVPIVGQLITTGHAFLTLGIFGGYSAINLMIGLLVLYLAIGALMGKYSYFPWISDNIKQML